MPKGGFKSTPQDSRYARATSRILSTDNQDFFPEQTCRQIADAKKKLLEEAEAKAKSESVEQKPVIESKPDEPPVENKNQQATPADEVGE